MNDLQLEQSQFIDGFNDDLQKFIANDNCKNIFHALAQN
jgi:hypothetical protein